jgi:heme exporter protein C
MGKRPGQESGRWMRMGLTVLTVLAVAAAMYAALVYAPPDARMGEMQRIAYLHIPAAWVGLMALTVTFVASVLYLLRERRPGRAPLGIDDVAGGSAVLGAAFMGVAVASGSIWAKMAWNTWWTWSPRLTLSAVLLLVYVAYLMLRRAVQEPVQCARLAAVYGIVAFVTVPLDFFAIRWWRSIHPVVLTGQGLAMGDEMALSLGVCLAASTLLYVRLLIWRVRRAAQTRNDIP